MTQRLTVEAHAAQRIAFASVVIAVIVYVALAGWILDLSILTSWVPGAMTMKPATCVTFLLLLGSGRDTGRLALLVGAAAMVVGSMLIWIGVWPPLALIPITDGHMTSAQAPMSMMTACCLVAAMIARFAHGHYRMGIVYGYLTLTLIALVSQWPVPEPLSAPASMAIPTAICLWLYALILSEDYGRHI